MRFKGLQLVGFKSFADKTDIQFPGGVTCIVGPNGCGKSNVSDAVRWVLGESSAKNLRGSNMLDVIFNGTQRRRSLSCCEVTLLFTNEDRAFDIEFEEVAFTRRLFRSGESEYMINKKPCRRKDIVELLYSVGIGKDGYSIIGQNKIEQIMNAKAEDRRVVFEEATGTIVFKSQRMDIERKLANAQNDLNIYAQKLDEANRQVKPLREQAETAQKYNDLYSALKYQEINTYIYKYENIAIEQEKIELKLKDVEFAINNWREKTDELNKKSDQNKIAVMQADNDLKYLNSQLLEFTVKVEQKSGDAKLYREKAESLKLANNKLKEDIQNNLDKIEALKARKEIDSAEAESLKIDLKTFEDELKEIDERLSVENEKLRVLENEAKESQQNVINNLENLSKIRASKGSLSAKRDAVAERISEMEADCENAKQERNRISNEISSLEQEEKDLNDYIESEREVLAKKNNELLQVTSESKNASQNIGDCNVKINTLTNKYNFYLSIKDSYEGYKDSVKTLLTDAKNNKSLANKIKGVIADIVSTDKKYEIAMEVAFGANMQNIVTATADDAKELIGYLKQNRVGIITFLPVKSLKPHRDNDMILKAVQEKGACGLATKLVKYDRYYDNVISNLLGNTLIVDDLENATAIAKKYQNTFKIVTLEGDIIATSGSMTGGSRKLDKSTFFANERNIKEAEEQIELAKAEEKKLRQIRQNLEQRLYALTDELERLRESFNQAREKIAGITARKQNLVKSLDDSAKRLDDFEKSINDARKRLEDIDKDVSNAEKGEEEIDAQTSQEHNDVTNSNIEIEKLKLVVDELATKKGSINVEIAKINSNIDTIRVQNLNIDTQCQELENANVKAKKDIELNLARIEENESIAENVAFNAEEREEVEKIRKSIAEVEEKKKKLNIEIEDFEASKKSLSGEFELLNSKKNNHQVALAKIGYDLENIAERVSEEYNVTYETCKDMKDEEFDIASSNTTINKLKREMASLGAINHNAIDDFAELNERYTTMLTEKEDLEQAIIDLQSVLEKLKEEMQTKFLTGFNTINENFKEVFKEMFGGGSAYLEMDYSTSEDPLEAGIEIKACPPGKKITKISLMSGGERALTAIAILFAILKTNPMPFCILDEIEAALDDANVLRYAEYLKNFSKTTQFVVITHRKPTMEQADDLFGVTMQEKGVSKIVSVKLSDIDNKMLGENKAS